MKRPILTRIMLPALFMLALVLIGSAGAPAAAVNNKGQEGDSALTRTMQAFLRDQHAVQQELRALSAVPCVGGFADIYPCDNVDLLSFLPLADIGGGSGNDIWGWTDPLDGKEYAIMGRTSGTSFVDISDPENPIYLGNLPTHTSSSSWRDIKTYADHAFIVSEASGHGMQVFDLTRLRTVVSPPVTFTSDAHYNAFGNAHNIVINEDSGYAYAVGTSTCSGGLHMVNITNPTSPTNAGCFSSDGYTHDAQCIIYTGPDVSHQGQEICFNSNEDTLTIVDVTNKAAPVQLSRTGYSGRGYTHQGWVTEDQRYFLLDDELDESSFGHNTRTRVWDIVDLDAPVLLGYTDGTTTAIDHNLYVKGDYVYQSNYRAGLRIMELTDLPTATLTEKAYFDIYPSSNSAAFNGSWSNYPYFDSGVVVVSGIEQGLFVVAPNLQADFRVTVETDTLEVCETGLPTVLVEVDDLNGYEGSVTLSAVGLPGGSSAMFSPNPVVVPGTSNMTITIASTPPGNYTFAVNGTDGSLSHDVNMTLNVYSGAPTPTMLLSPANGESDVSPVPTLTWDANGTANRYDVAISTTPSVSGIIASAMNLTGTSWTSPIPLDPLTTYYWGVRAKNPCGGASFSAVYSFTTRDIPPVLLVDDDDNNPNVQTTYTAALTAAGLAYDVWDTGNSDNEPDAATLAQYDMVVWFSGDEFGGAAGPGDAGETALASYLDDYSGCLFISSQDYYWDRGLTGFMTDYLGISAATSDVSQTSVTGAISNPPFGGTHPLSYPFTNYSDRLTVGNGGAELYNGNQGLAAVYKLGPTYQTTYWGFPMEALPLAEHGPHLAKIFLACQYYQAEGIDLFARR